MNDARITPEATNRLTRASSRVAAADRRPLGGRVLGRRFLVGYVNSSGVIARYHSVFLRGSWGTAGDYNGPLGMPSIDEYGTSNVPPGGNHSGLAFQHGYNPEVVTLAEDVPYTDGNSDPYLWEASPTGSAYLAGLLPYSLPFAPPLIRTAGQWEYWLRCYNTGSGPGTTRILLNGLVAAQHVHTTPGERSVRGILRVSRTSRLSVAVSGTATQANADQWRIKLWGPAP